MEPFREGWLDLVTLHGGAAKDCRAEIWLHRDSHTEVGPSLARFVADKLARGERSVIISPDIGKLPPGIVVSADYTIHLDAPDAALVADVVAKLCDARPEARLDDGEAAALDPGLLRLAYRVGQSPESFMKELEDLIDIGSLEVVEAE